MLTENSIEIKRKLFYFILNFNIEDSYWNDKSALEIEPVNKNV